MGPQLPEFLRIFTRLVCYKRQRFSYDTGRIKFFFKINIKKNYVQSYLWKVIPRDLVSVLRRKLHKILA